MKKLIITLLASLAALFTLSAQKNGEMLNKIADGYDVKLKKETADEWHFRCTRSRDNTNKDDPKTMDLIVSKATYLPVSVKTSQSLVTVILRPAEHHAHIRV